MLSVYKFITVLGVYVFVPYCYDNVYHVFGVFLLIFSMATHVVV